jgi:hypothetical protein
MSLYVWHPEYAHRTTCVTCFKTLVLGKKVYACCLNGFDIGCSKCKYPNYEDPYCGEYCSNECVAENIGIINGDIVIRCLKCKNVMFRGNVKIQNMQPQEQNYVDEEVNVDPFSDYNNGAS